MKHSEKPYKLRRMGIVKIHRIAMHNPIQDEAKTIPFIQKIISKMKKLFIVLLATLGACTGQNEATISPANLSELSIEFDPIAGDESLWFGRKYEVNKQDYTVDELKFFVSNIKLTQENGTIYTVPQDSSYFSINIENQRFATFKVPEGNYTHLEFILGVDSLRNTLPLENRTGVLSLNPENEGASMYWGRNSGYIFFKIEGESSLATSGRYRYHIGGFGGYNSPTINNIKTINIDLKKAGIANVRNGFKSNIHLFLDVEKVFKNVDILTHSSVMMNPFSTVIANNFLDLFTHDHTENFVK